METKARFSPEVRQWAARLALGQQREHESKWAAIDSVTGKIACRGETLRTLVRRSVRDLGRRDGLTDSNRASAAQATGAVER